MRVVGRIIAVTAIVLFLPVAIMWKIMKAAW